MSLYEALIWLQAALTIAAYAISAAGVLVLLAWTRRA